MIIAKNNRLDTINVRLNVRSFFVGKELLHLLPAATLLRRSACKKEMMKTISGIWDDCGMFEMYWFLVVLFHAFVVNGSNRMVKKTFYVLFAKFVLCLAKFLEGASVDFALKYREMNWVKLGWKRIECFRLILLIKNVLGHLSSVLCNQHVNHHYQ